MDRQNIKRQLQYMVDHEGGCGSNRKDWDCLTNCYINEHCGACIESSEAFPVAKKLLEKILLEEAIEEVLICEDKV